MPGLARPVRMCVSVDLNAPMDLSICSCACFLISGMVVIAMLLSSLPLSSGVHQRAFVLAHHDAAQRTVLEDGEDLDRQLLVTAQRERRGVHDAEILRHRIVER